MGGERSTSGLDVVVVVLVRAEHGRAVCVSGGMPASCCLPSIRGRGTRRVSVLASSCHTHVADHGEYKAYFGLLCASV